MWSHSLTLYHTVGLNMKPIGPEDRKRHHTTDFVEVNDAVYKWYCLARQRNIPVSRPLLQEEALQIAKGIDADTHQMVGLIV